VGGLARRDVQPGKDVGGVKKAEDDGRLPMAWISVFGREGAQARAVAEAVVHEAFHNVADLGATFDA
jgi:hypothetical protein